MGWKREREGGKRGGKGKGREEKEKGRREGLASTNCTSSDAPGSITISLTVQTDIEVLMTLIHSN